MTTDEVIDGRRRPKGPTAVEADTNLQVLENGSVHLEGGALAAEQECPELGSLTQSGRVVLPYVPQPGASDEFHDELVEGPERRRYTRIQLDGGTVTEVGVQELELLPPDGLKFPERHLADDRIHLRQDAGPGSALLTQVLQRWSVFAPGLFQDSDDPGLPAGVLGQDTRLRASDGERDRLAPVELDDDLGDLASRESQGCAGIVASADCQVGQGMKQGELVTGHEASFAEQPLQALEELHLARWRARAR